MGGCGHAGAAPVRIWMWGGGRRGSCCRVPGECGDAHRVLGALPIELPPGRRRWAGLEPESVNLCDAPGRGFYRVVASVFWGGLIQELAGISGGSGGLLTKRSGWAA